MARRAAYLLFAAALALNASPAAARGLQIGPIKVQMVGPERTASLTIRNIDPTPTSVQIRPMDWSQPDGADVLAPSDTLLVSPPLATLAPGEEQTIRLVIRNVPDASTEHAYRVILDEIPPPATKGGAGVQTALRALVPVFLTPSLQSSARLRWTAQRTPSGVSVTLFNDGDTHEHVSNLTISAGGQALNGGADLNGYVLSHGKRTWILNDTTAATSLDIAGQGLNGAVEAHAQIGN